MSRNPYKTLWKQLKILILHEGKKRYTKKELVVLMTGLEIGQGLNEEPWEVE